MAKSGLAPSPKRNLSFPGILYEKYVLHLSEKNSFDSVGSVPYLQANPVKKIHRSFQNESHVTASVTSAIFIID